MRVIVDVNNLVYRSAYKLHLTDREGNNTGAAYGTLKSIGRLADLLRPEEMIICWDGPDSTVRRVAVYPEYKQNRKRDPAFVEDLLRQKAVLREMLRCLPVVQVLVPGVEADDAIAAIVAFCRMEKIGIVTSDHDLYCLASERCRIFDPHGAAVKLDLRPDQYVAYKALVGDASDNIKGVPGIGDVRARRLLTTHGTLDRILGYAYSAGRLDSVPLTEAEWHLAQEAVDRNVKLMTPGLMLSNSERTEVLNQYRYGRLSRPTDVPELRRLLMRSGFTSIVSRLTGWLMPFRRMERTGKDQVDGKAKAQAEAEGQVRAESGSGSEAGQGRRGDTAWARIIRAVEPSTRIHRAVVPREAASRSRVLEAAAARLGGVHQEEALGVAPAGGQRCAAGAVRPAGVRQTKLGTRRRGTGNPLAPVLHDAEVLRRKRVRAREAVSLLPLFRAGERWAWLRGRPSRELRRVLELIERVVIEPDGRLPDDDVDFLHGLEEAFTNEMPAWMQTEKELKDNAKNIIKGKLRPGPQ